MKPLRRRPAARPSMAQRHSRRMPTSCRCSKHWSAGPFWRHWRKAMANPHTTATEMRVVPPYIPWPRATVLVSGVFELLGALGLLHPSTRRPLFETLVRRAILAALEKGDG